MIRTWRHAPKHVELIGRELEGPVCDAVGSERRPCFSAARILETRWHDTDDLERPAAGRQRDLPSDDSRVAGEVLLPGFVAQYEDWCAAARVILDAERAT